MTGLNKVLSSVHFRSLNKCWLVFLASCGIVFSLVSCTKESSNEQTPVLKTESNADSSSWKQFDDPKANEFMQFCEANYAEVEHIFTTSKIGYENDTQLLEAFGEIDRLINITLARASLYANVHPSADFRESAELCDQNFTKLISDISLSQALFTQAQSINLSSLEGVDKRYVSDLLRDFKRAGVDKDQQTRERIKVLNEEINLASMEFYKNSREDVRTLSADVEDLAGLPEDFIQERIDAESGLVKITTNYPDYFPVMQYAENDELRLKLYTLFRSRGNPKNVTVLQSLLEKRYELARLVGYENYAEYVTDVQMIGTPEKAQSFINDISAIAKPLAAKEYQTLLAELQKVSPEATEVGDWQKTFLQERIKKQAYELDSQELRSYFPYQHVKGGIIQLVEQLFEIDIRPWQTETWHEDVEAFELVDGNEVLGRFFLDMHPREGKYKHAAAFTLQDGIVGKQLPIKALVCNFPSGDDFMEHTQVETFLHEFGHLLHGIFGGKPKWINHAGTSTERDFVEAPSQMLEEWVWDRTTLSLLSKNEAGETIPDTLIDKLNQSRNFGKGVGTTQQMFYASVSLNYYNRDPSTFDPTDLLISLQSEYGNFSYVDNTAFQYSFGHLVGYSAVYYGYMWSLVIAEDLFSEFKKSGLMNKEVAARYRKEILEPGGTKDANDMVEAFLGRPYSFDAFSEKFH